MPLELQSMADTAKNPDDIAANVAENDDKNLSTTVDDSQGDDAVATPVQTPDAGATDNGGDDDNNADQNTSDPLLLAQMPKAEPVETKTPAVTKTAPVPTKKADTAATEKTKPAVEKHDEDPNDGTRESDADIEKELSEAVADLPPEDWKNLSHKAKSQFLTQKRVAKTLLEREKTARLEAKKAREDYQEVDKFVRSTGLSEKEYINTLTVSSLIKRGDPKAIPALEETLRNLKKVAGIVDVPQVVGLDPDVDAVLKEVEELGIDIDTSKIRAKFAAKPAPTTVKVDPAPTAAEPNVPASNDAEVDEFRQMIDTMLEEKVADTEEAAADYIREMVTTIPGLAKVKPGSRYRAVLKEHYKRSAAIPATTIPPRQHRAAPVSGRNGPPVLANSTKTNDPVKLALMPRGR